MIVGKSVVYICDCVIIKKVMADIMKGNFHMAKIISIIFISLIGWIVTGYDFFVISSLLSFSIELKDELDKIQKRYNKNTKDKMANKTAI